MDQGDIVEPRSALGEALVRLGQKYPALVVLSPDVSLSTKAIKFNQAFPERFICSGISEQNTVGMAAGLSTMGWIPIVAGYAMFVAGKAWEPLRNSIAYSNNNVKIVATHCGINVGPDGVTHQAIEDIALMRAIPGMVVLAPTDAGQVESAVQEALDYYGPVYIRLERAATPIVSKNIPMQIGQSQTLRDGKDVTIIAIGGMVALSLQAAEILAAEGVEARVISMTSIKPLDEEAVASASCETGAIVVAEDHNRLGGLGAAIAESLVRKYPAPMEQVAIGDVFAESGPVPSLYTKYHLTKEDIIAAVKKVIVRRGSMVRDGR